MISLFFSTTWQSIEHPFSKSQKFYWLWRKKIVSNEWVVKWGATQRGRVKVAQQLFYNKYAEIHIPFWYKTSSYIFYRLKGAERKHAMKRMLNGAMSTKNSSLFFYKSTSSHESIYFLSGRFDLSHKSFLLETMRRKKIGI